MPIDLSKCIITWPKYNCPYSSMCIVYVHMYACHSYTEYVLIFSDTLIISVFVALVDNTVHLQLYQLHHTHNKSLFIYTQWWPLLYSSRWHGHHEMSCIKRTLLLYIRRLISCTRKSRLCPNITFHWWQCH